MTLKDRLVDQMKAKQQSFKRKISEETRFIRELAGSPVKTGAISPSGDALAKKMASFVDPKSPLPVLELGPGTGAITRGLLKAGIPEDQLHLVEYSEEFSRHLADRFPHATLVQGSAYELTRILRIKHCSSYQFILMDKIKLTETHMTVKITIYICDITDVNIFSTPLM